MRKVLYALLFLLLSSLSYGQTSIRLEDLPYNQKPHSVQRHSSMLAIMYSSWLDLERSQRRMIRKQIKVYYATAFAEKEQPNRLYLHIHLHEKLKEILTVKQFERYTRSSSFPEFDFSGGAPLATPPVAHPLLLAQ